MADALSGGATRGEETVSASHRERALRGSSARSDKRMRVTQNSVAERPGLTRSDKIARDHQRQLLRPRARDSYDSESNGSLSTIPCPKRASRLNRDRSESREHNTMDVFTNVYKARSCPNVRIEGCAAPPVTFRVPPRDLREDVTLLFIGAVAVLWERDRESRLRRPWLGWRRRLCIDGTTVTRYRIVQQARRLVHHYNS